MTRPRDIADSINRINSSAADATAVTIDSSENVGIGLTDPDTPLEIQRGSSGNALKLSSSADGASVFLAFEQQESGTKHVRGRIRAASNGVEGGLIFETGASSSTSEVMRIMNDGTVLIGQTNDSSASTGHIFTPEGSAFHIRDNSTPLVLNRLTSDGKLADFRKVGTTVGFITVRANVVSSIVLDPRGGGSGISASGRAILPTNEGGTTNNDVCDLGDSGSRWSEIFCVNGTINTSDENEKQQIASLTDKEILAAKAISKLFKTFKWNSAVETKGENARTHTGVIAQEVKAALEAESLDPTKYSFFCSDTYWELETEVPAVKGDEENGIEAQDAYTERVVYHTADDAPDGAKEHTVLGVRYNELISFISAATEQRLTSIEARLTALENS